MTTEVWPWGEQGNGKERERCGIYGCEMWRKLRGSDGGGLVKAFCRVPEGFHKKSTWIGLKTWMGEKRMETPRKLTSRSGKRFFFLHKGRIGVIYLGRGKMAWLLRTPQWEKKLYCQKLKILVKNIKCQPWKLWNRSHRSILRHNKNHISLNKMQNMITLLSFQCQSRAQLLTRGPT